MQRHMTLAAQCTPQVAAPPLGRRWAAAPLLRHRLLLVAARGLCASALTQALHRPCPATDDTTAQRGGAGGSPWTAEGSRSGRMLGSLPWRRGSKASLRGGSTHG